MSATIYPLTYEELCKLPTDGTRYEIIDGELYLMPSLSFRHQELLMRLMMMITLDLQTSGFGEILPGPLDTRLTRHDIVQPDLQVFRAEDVRRDVPLPVDIRPALVVEVLSPSNPKHDQVTKFRLYAAAGIPEYWIVDPERTALTIFVPPDGAYEPLPQDGPIFRSRILPRLEIDTHALFADLLPNG